MGECEGTAACAGTVTTMGYPDALFSDRSNIPDHDWVLRQTLTFDAAYLKEKLPDSRMWPSELDDLPDDGKWRSISRRDVFGIAERAVLENDPWAASQLHVAIVAWGAGNKAQRIVRALWPLDDPSAPEKFAKALRVVRGEGALSAYRALNKRGSLKVHRLGAGFFTKFLYFGGYDAKPYVGYPLIYDSRVVAALNKVTEDEWFDDGPVDMYERYIDLAKNWAWELDTAPDVIERRLFDLGT